MPTLHAVLPAPLQTFPTRPTKTTIQPGHSRNDLPSSNDRFVRLAPSHRHARGWIGYLDSLGAPTKGCHQWYDVFDTSGERASHPEKFRSL